MNKTIMSGRLVEDPVLKNTASNIAVCSFRIAVDREYLVDGKRKADFFDAVAWRKSAEFLCRYFKKGKFILVEGHFEARSYDDKQNIRRKVVELIVDRLEFGGDTAGKDTVAGLPEPPPETKGGQASADFSEVSADTDDLPF